MKVRSVVRSAALAAVGLLGASCAPDDSLGTNTSAVRGAVYTTVNGDDAHAAGCLDSPNGINCNHYDIKQHVFLSGGPINNGLSDGTYFYAILVPGYQNGGFLDGAEGNLSDTTAGGTAGDNGTGDLVANRTIQVMNHQIVSFGTGHTIGTSPDGHPVVGAFPFDDTSNGGGVYILAVCAVGAMSSSDCKFDAFHVEQESPPCDWGDCSEPPPPPCNWGDCGPTGTGTPPTPGEAPTPVPL